MPQVASWGKGKLCKRVDLWHLRFTKTLCKDNKLTKKCMAISDFIRLRKLGRIQGSDRPFKKGLLDQERGEAHEKGRIDDTTSEKRLH